MKPTNSIMVAPNDSIRKTIEIIDASTMQIALVVDEKMRLLGTVTDGDIRRGILRGLSVDDAVGGVMNPQPTTVSTKETREEILALMKQKKIRQIPVLNETGQVTTLEVFDDIVQAQAQDNWVVLMAGGLGTRLHPLTDECPKPLLKVGSKPLLETTLENFLEAGFKRFYLSVNYKAEMIEDYFGDGSKWGAEIRYIYENKKMGTAGALGLLPERPSKPFFVMNGDLLTKVSFQQILDFHVEQQVQATMCVREYHYQIPYGVVQLDNQRFKGIKEKPVQKYFINAGIYVLEPSCLEYIPPDQYFDMPSLFKKLYDQKYETIVFPIREYWMDIGHMEDFLRANEEYVGLFE